MARPPLSDRFGGDSGFGEHALGCAGSGPRLAVVAGVAQGHAEPGQGDDDVEGAVIAAVGDADDPALQPALAAGDGDPVTVAQFLRAVFEQLDERAVYIAEAEKTEIVGADGALAGASFKVARFQSFNYPTMKP